MANENPTVTLPMKIERFFEVKAKLVEAEDVVSKLSKQKEAMSFELIETLEAEGLQSAKDSKGRSVYLQAPRFYASINKENLSAARKYLKRNLKLGYLFRDELSSSALGRVVKERIEKGLDVPEEFITYTTKRTIGNRAGKSKGGS